MLQMFLAFLFASAGLVLISLAFFITVIAVVLWRESADNDSPVDRPTAKPAPKDFYV
jgi:hypothetical protein